VIVKVNGKLVSMPTSILTASGDDLVSSVSREDVLAQTSKAPG
jgi:hypothetical protein